MRTIGNLKTKKCILTFAILMGFVVPSSAGMKDFVKAEFEDLLLYEGNGPEIILTHEGSSGSGHFLKEIRIFIDKDDSLEKVFGYPLVEEHYFSGIYPKEHVAFVGEVKFSESNKETGYRDLIVKTTKYIFSNDPASPLPEGEDKGIFAWGGVVLKKEDLGTMRFRWDVEQHEYALVGDVPPKIAEKYAFEEKVYDDIKKKGKKVGNMIFW